MSRGTDFIKAVDAFMLIGKGVKGVTSPEWQEARDEYALRIKLPIEAGGEISGQHLVVDAFPEHDPRRFSIGILFADRIVCRLDYDPPATHSNGWAGDLPPIITGPHWHSWELNRSSFKKMSSRHQKLERASSFSEAREFDACLRWYCNTRNIALGSHGINYPRRGTLL